MRHGHAQPCPESHKKFRIMRRPDSPTQDRPSVPQIDNTISQISHEIRDLCGLTAMRASLAEWTYGVARRTMDRSRRVLVDNTGTLLRDSSDDYLNGSPAQPGGLLKSKPTWPETFGFSATSAFFCAVGGASPRPRYADACVWS